MDAVLFDFQNCEMRELAGMLPRIAAVNSNVLITGESGTGKELVAQRIHRLSPRSKAPMVEVNCSAIPDSLLESELFGHERGSFTGAAHRKYGLIEEAHGGTLFLDEIGDMPLSLQAKILRIVQNKTLRPLGSTRARPVDFRLICATNCDLQSAAEQGRFRQDLLYRLSVIPLHIPPLRERKEDIPGLIAFFLKKHCAANGLPLRRFSDEAERSLCARPWHGNIRELENFIERVVVISTNDFIGSDEFLSIEQRMALHRSKQATGKPVPLKELIDQQLQAALTQTNGHQGKAAELLGISRRTLSRKLRGLAKSGGPLH